MVEVLRDTNQPQFLFYFNVFQLFGSFQEYLESIPTEIGFINIAGQSSSSPVFPGFYNNLITFEI